MFNFHKNSIANENKNAFQKSRDLTEALELLTYEAQNQLGPITQTAFFIGDGLQRTMINGIHDVFRPQTWSPGNIWRMGSSLASGSARLSKLLSPSQAQLVWQELKNKAEVFALVRNLSAILKLPKDKFIPLPELVEKAYGLSPFAALWAVEGLGHYYADDYWVRHGEPDGLLLEENAPVPAKSLLMLHAGIGLCFADRLLGGTLSTQSTPDEVRAALERFVALCLRNSRPGYAGAAIESLGLITRDFHPDLFKIVGQQFPIVAPEFTGFYWHGIGRAVYYSRKFFIPRLLSMWSDVNIEATTRPERLNVMAGLIWAFMLVNMRHPEIVAATLQMYNEDSPLAEGAANGVCSCVIMRSDMTPGEPFVSAFYHYHTRMTDRKAATTWERQISQPAQAGVESYHPVLQQHQALDQVFRYQDLAQLVEQLQTGSTVRAGGDSASNGCECCDASEKG